MKSLHAILILVTSLLLFSPHLRAEENTGRLDLANMAIPESLGKVDERFQGTSKRWVIDIQDVHAHFGAQENIAAIIDHLNMVYGLRLVAYEGGWSVTSYPRTWEIPSSRKKQLVLRTLMEEDLITGSAFAAMNAKTPIVLHGVEDPELYKKNLAVYLEFIRRKESIEKKISAHQTVLSQKKEALFNESLLSFDQSLLQFREDSKNAESFLPKLLSHAKESALDFDTLPQMRLFEQVRAIEKTIDKEKLKSEIDRLMHEHKNSRLSFEEMLRHGTFTEEKLSFYPNAEKQSSLLKLHDQIIHEQLFAEIETTVKLVKDKLYQNDAERELDASFSRFVTAKKLMSFKATPADFKQYHLSKSLIQEEMKEAGLTKELKLGARFYKLAQQRDHVFFKQLTTLPELASEDVALIAGGFHTEGVREQLRGAGISYIVITPHLDQQAPNEALYFERLQGLRFLTQTLSEIGNRMNDAQDERIADALQQFESGKLRDIRQVVDYVAQPQRTVKAAGENFLDLSENDQLNAVEAAVTSVLSGEEPVFAVIRADALQKILDTSSTAEALLKAIIQNPANHMTILYRSFVDVPEVISDAFGSDNIKTVGETDLSRAIGRQRDLQTALKQNKLAVIADDYTHANALVLKESPIALLLFRPLLEQGWTFAWENPESLSLIGRLAEQVLIDKGLLASA